MISEPGEYSLTKEQYEADPVEGGSLRSSVAWIMVNQTPAHAYHAMTTKREDKRHFDIGAVAHQMLLGKGGEVEIIEAENYLSKAAKDVRDRARRMGKTPILQREHDEVAAMVGAVRQQLKSMVDYGSLDAEPFQHNETERCIVWREDNGVWCRAALDGLSLDGESLSEFKTEGENADPKTWAWKARKFGYVFKVAFYCRGLSRLRICHSPAARFFVAEKTAPFAMSCLRVDDELLSYEHNRILEAIKLFGRCKAQDRWPGYSLDGYDLTLTERERMSDQKQLAGSHVSSEDIAYTL